MRLAHTSQRRRRSQEEKKCQRLDYRCVWMVVVTLMSSLLLYTTHVYRQDVHYWRDQFYLVLHPREDEDTLASWDQVLRQSLNQSKPQRHAFSIHSSSTFDAAVQQVYHDLFVAETTTAATDGTAKTEDEGDDDLLFKPVSSAFTKNSVIKSPPQSTSTGQVRRSFDIREWERWYSGRTTTGGLLHEDRILLGSIYSNATSVFEYGLGESTFMADYLGVTRYAGIDSDATYIATTRQQISSTRFRFYFADVGQTKAWGYPASPALSKNILHYQLMPLLVEPLPFDVYLVDGRWRLACMLLCFLHASARANVTNSGGDHRQHSIQSPATKVLIHDCMPRRVETQWFRRAYKQADHLLTLVQHSGAKLCVYQRKESTTDQQLLDLWQQFSHVLS